MSSSPTPASQPQPPTGLGPAPLPIEPLHLTYGLFVLTGLFAAIPIAVLIQFKGNVQAAINSVFAWGVVLALAALSAALVNLSLHDERLTEGDKGRLVLLSLGGACGFATTVLGAYLPFSDFFREQLAGGLEGWRTAPRKALLLPALAFLGGLGLMFASLQLGRGMERSNQTMRRLIYGYNAVLTGLLLLAILALPNLLAYAAPFSRFMGKTDDWTKGQVYTLQQDTRNYLTALDTSVSVYVMLDPNDPRSADMAQLLENCRAVTPKLKWFSVPSRPEGRSEPGRAQGEIQRKYKLSEVYGMLVVVGDDEKNEKWDFVPASDLGRSRGPEGDDYVFTGERALLNSLRFASEGKAVYYFTQGSGELPIQGPSPMMPRARDQATLGELNRRLTQRKGVEVRPLQATAADKGVPADADVVIVAGPKSELPKEFVKALEKYLDRKGEKKGKLILLLDPLVQLKGGKQRARTGLEGLLAKNNVKLGDDIVCDSLIDRPDVVYDLEVITNPETQNPIARAFSPVKRNTAKLFRLQKSRTVTPAAGPKAGPMAGGGAVVEDLLITLRGGYWAEEDPNVDVVDKAARLEQMRSSDNIKDVLEWRRLCGKRLCVAVTVTAPVVGVPGDPAHSRLQKPRMVVFGSSTWLQDESLTRWPANFDLFDNSLSWARERPTVGEGVDPIRKPYEINIVKERFWSLILLPPLLLMLGVIGIGCGVWVVRRR